MALFLSGCADTITPNLSDLSGRRASVAIMAPADLNLACRAYGFGFETQACVLIARNKEEAKEMTRRWYEAGGVLDCFIAAPPNAALVVHELTLCATMASGYWHTRHSP